MQAEEFSRVMDMALESTPTLVVEGPGEGEGGAISMFR